MKKTTMLFLLFVSMHFYAQNNYYYKNKVKQNITVSTKYINLFVDVNFDKASLQRLGLKTQTWHTNEIKPTELWATVEFVVEPTEIEYVQKTNTLKNTRGVMGVCKHFKNDNFKTVGLSNLFYVELKSISDTIKLKQLAAEKNVSILYNNKFMPNWFALYRNKTAVNDVLELSNTFFESNLFENVDPNFLLDFRIIEPNNNPEFCDVEQDGSDFCANDLLFSQQWAYKNDYHPDVDINICPAWSISTGANTKVAIIDSGLQLNHPDLLNNIDANSYNTLTNSSPSAIYGSHGTFTAGIVGAEANNSVGIAGTAPHTKLLSVSFPPNGVGYITLTEMIGEGILWSVDNGADVINNSWGVLDNTFSSPFLESAINYATNQGENEPGRDGKGCIVVFAAGNESTVSMRYPANNPNLNILTVGAIRPDGQKASFSAFGSTLDVVAPGVCILSTSSGSGTYTDEGTSFAAPHVAGVAALMLSVNPCLTRQQVYDIIEQTAQKVNNTVAPFIYGTTPNRQNGTWNNKVGYGLLDADAAVKKAKQLVGKKLDLYIKDNVADLGIEPNITTTTLWNSPNIWVRNNQDGLTEHEVPKYNQTTPNYVYVKVENKSCFVTTGTEQVKLYFSKPSTTTPIETSVAFRSSFVPVTGTEWVLIGSVNMPVLSAGANTTLVFPWTLPDPVGMYDCTSTSFNTSLLAKIVAGNDLNSLPETNNMLTNIQNNNNIAGKNLIVIDVNYLTSPIGNNTEASILVANPYNENHSFSIEMIKENLEEGKPIYEEAEVSFEMDEMFYNAWDRGGKNEENTSSTSLSSKKIVENNNVLLNNISLNANELATLKLNFNFLTDELTNKSKYLYHIIQKDIDSGEIVSAVSFEIEKGQRSPFNANAGEDQEVDKNESITISATDINEPAIYNWYDASGNLIFQGKDLTIGTQVSQKYKLEVIATTDGFKDFSEVEVNLKPSGINSITPNPATDIIAINYKINEGNTAYLMVLGGYGTFSTSNNYILDVDRTETKLDISNYTKGFYTIVLVVNGQIIDAKTLVKE